jgi:hypothetical protein
MAFATLDAEVGMIAPVQLAMFQMAAQSAIRAVFVRHQ